MAKKDNDKNGREAEHVNQERIKEIIQTQVGILQEFTRAGGRGNNFDYTASLEDGTLWKGELKTSEKKITELHQLPQFLEVSAKTHEIIPGFILFCFRTMVRTLRSLCPDIPVIKEEDYCRLISRIKHTCHPFFTYLYNHKKNDGAFAKELSRLGNLAITDFISVNKTSINTGLIQSDLNTQNRKIFVLMCRPSDSFSVRSFSDKDLQFDSITEVLNNKILFKAKSGMKYTLTLRWANDIGILNPSWKFKVAK